MSSFLKKIYLLMSPQLFWFIASMLILHFAFIWSTDTDLFHVYFGLEDDGKLAVLALLGAYFGFLFKIFQSVRVSNPVIDLYDFEGEALQKNHSEKGTNPCIQTCSLDNKCHDWHIVNVRLIDDDPIFDVNAVFPASPDISLESKRRLYKGHEIQLHCREKDFRELLKKSTDGSFALQLQFRKKNGDRYREWYKIFIEPIDETANTCGGVSFYAIQSYEVTRNSLFQMTRRELLKSIWLNLLGALHIRTEFIGEEWVETI